VSQYKTGACSVLESSSQYQTTCTKYITRNIVAAISTGSTPLKACFAGSESVSLESGEVKLISEVRTGDRVLAADASRQTVFSEVVFVPHVANTDSALFTHITTTQGRDIKMTHSHILPAGACGSSSLLLDVYASSVAVGDCIITVSGMERVSAVETVQGQGLYTIVTGEEYVVVNGIIASPFAYNHMVANFYYNIHRFVYAFVPRLSGSPLTRSTNEVRHSRDVVVVSAIWQDYDFLILV
jgi:Hint module